MSWWQIEGARAIGEAPDVGEITHDSRLVKPGTAFAAVPGFQSDGHDYIEAALRAGAGALVVQADREAKWRPFQEQAPLVVVEDVRAALGPLAAAVYGDPSEKLRIVGVTGTDGKTTTTHLTAHVLDRCGLACGYLTSVGFDTGGGFEPNTLHMTTMEGTLVQAALAGAVAAGRRSMVVEASSEGLALHRLDGCRFDAAIFTNLSRDHLDFHGTMERYLEAKGILFEKLGETSAKDFPKAAVINADQMASAYISEKAKAPLITYGIDNGADFQARARFIRSEGYGLSFRVEAEGTAVEARAPLVGLFNVYNCLAAVGVARSQGVALEDAVAALASFPGVPGRLEVIDCGQPFRVYVDIASTPAAMENVLRALRPATKGLLWVVFGAAGGRDPARRSGIGGVVAQLADRAVLTNEDPREEDPAAIIAEIGAAMGEAGRVEGRDFFRVTDRREAIGYVFEKAVAGDTVLLAGKGTETTMIIGREALPWDERSVARELLGRRPSP
jgi:UDP-N-acetylmuramoyl-L-alanyl-D-glutamate--2,6-diaminopimelate ligase